MTTKKRQDSKTVLSLFHCIQSIELAGYFQNNIGERKRGAGVDIPVYFVTVTASLVLCRAVYLTGDELAAAPAARSGSGKAL